jgi:hypothetical protein
MMLADRHRLAYDDPVLLGLIVEHIAGQLLPRFLESQIFKPLRMASTFLLTILDQKAAGVARGYDESGGADDFEGMETGDSGVYSTVHDLLRFDQALYTETLVQAADARCSLYARARPPTILVIEPGCDSTGIAVPSSDQL